jgi:trans-2,3-dihydro-3-hydroxyanthranilate isomerase
VVADVFTQKPLEGNQLAVFTDARGLSIDQMLRTAKEFNLPETVFVLPPEQGGDARIRIFTPTVELSFAGHPVLGAAFVVADSSSTQTVRLETGVGLVPITLERDGGRVVFGRMEQRVPTPELYEPQEELLRAVGVLRSKLPVEAYRNGPLHVYIELDDEGAVAALRPDMEALTKFPEVSANCYAGAGRHWKTRVFLPALGIAEDAASGSAAGPLAVHLARHQRIGFGEQIEIHQGAELGRPSVLYARADGSPDGIERVEVGGSAVIVGRGEYRLS